MSTSLAEQTDQFDVVLDLASSTLSDGSTVEAMRLARGLMAMETYMDRMAIRIERLEKVMEAAKGFRGLFTKNIHDQKLAECAKVFDDAVAACEGAP